MRITFQAFGIYRAPYETDIINSFGPECATPEEARAHANEELKKILQKNKRIEREHPTWYDEDTEEWYPVEQEELPSCVEIQVLVEGFPETLPHEKWPKVEE